jgi:hypothetical protein
MGGFAIWNTLLPIVVIVVIGLLIRVLWKRR